MQWTEQTGLRFSLSALIAVALAGWVGTSDSLAHSNPSIAAGPQLQAPPNGGTLTSFGPRLSWVDPAGTTQLELQVIPAANDGPGVDVHLGSPETAFQIPPPPQWYGLLPGMTYTWRVRASDATAFASLDDESWGPWSEWTLRTPVVASTAIALTSPVGSAVVTTLTPVLQWSNARRPDLFYYELQLSKDLTFNTDPATATASVYSALIHGGVTTPPNSYTVPATAPLEPDTQYAWRIRPRVQGDGTPVEWSRPAAFRTPGNGKASPAPSPSTAPPASKGPATR